MKLKKNTRRKDNQSNEKNGEKMKKNNLIIAGSIVAILSYPIIKFVFGKDNILKEFVFLLTFTFICIGIGLIIAGVIKEKYWKEVKWYHILEIILSTIIVLYSIQGLIFGIFYGVPLVLIIKPYGVWYFLSVLIIVFTLCRFRKKK